MTDWPVAYRRKVRYSDSDAQGIVFNANYLTYFDDTITDYFDAIDMPWHRFGEHGVDIVLGRVEVDFRSGPRIGDTIETRARVTGRGRSSLEFRLETRDVATDELVVEGREIQVIVDAETFRPTEIPQPIIDAIERAQGPIPPRSA